MILYFVVDSLTLRQRRGQEAHANDCNVQRWSPGGKPIRGISMKKRARVTSDVMRIIKGSDASLESKTGNAINAREARGKFSDFLLF